MRVLFGAVASSLAAGGDDDPLLVQLQRSPELPHHRGTHVPFPALHLYCCAHFGQSGCPVGAGHVDAAIAAVGRDLHRVLVEPHLDQQLADQRLESLRGHGLDQVGELLPGPSVDLLHVGIDPLRLPLRQPKAAMPGADKERALLLGIGVQARAHRRYRGQPLRGDELLIQRSLGDLFVVQRLAGSLKDGVGGVKIGHLSFPFILLQSRRAEVVS
jgi:hypothetical protein